MRMGPRPDFQKYYLRKTGTLQVFLYHCGWDRIHQGFFDCQAVLSAYDAILENSPAHYSIEALEDAVIETIDYDKFRQLFSEDPCWNNFLVALLQKGYLAKVQREREFLLMNAEQRYHAFLKRYPDLEQRIKQHIIASYIGIALNPSAELEKVRPLNIDQ